MRYPERNSGYAVGNRSLILKTMDQGRTWNPIPTGESGNHFNAVAFVNSAEGHAIGTSGLMARTLDGGEIWTSQASKPFIPCIFPGRAWDLTAETAAPCSGQLMGRPLGAAWRLNRNR
jgi:hypothetical protein